MLYKHWNLYESLIYSTNIASKLNTWKESGRKDIETFIAYLGIPLDEAKQ